MKSKNILKLIDGNFTPAEAGSVLFALISTKINYHSMEAFSIKERTNGDVSKSENRIQELKITAKGLKEIIDLANERQYNLKIKGTIEINFIK